MMILNVISDIESNTLIILCPVDPDMWNMIVLWFEDPEMQNMTESMWLIKWKNYFVSSQWPLDVKYDRKGSFELHWPLDVKYDMIQWY
jgi:hypothetical protein